VNPELDRNALQVRWEANARHMNRIAAAPALNREMCAAEVERSRISHRFPGWLRESRVFGSTALVWPGLTATSRMCTTLH
jgi:hypothetical protein